jgi:acetyltransferase-like isoleucine patch superfamily enzyme
MSEAKIAKTAIIFPGVSFGKSVVVEDYCVIGIPSNNTKCEKTVIGDGAIIRSGTYIYAGNIIGNNFQTGNKANIRELNEIGDNVSIGTLTVVEHHVVIENEVRIHTQAFIPEYSRLRSGCWIGPNVVLTNSSYPKHPNAKDNLKGVVVGNNAKIGANSTLLPGVIVGANSVVGAGSVVTKNVSKGIVVAGTPAKVLRNIDY